MKHLRQREETARIIRQYLFSRRLQRDMAVCFLLLIWAIVGAVIIAVCMEWGR